MLILIYYKKEYTHKCFGNHISRRSLCTFRMSSYKENATHQFFIGKWVNSISTGKWAIKIQNYVIMSLSLINFYLLIYSIAMRYWYTPSIYYW